MAVLRLLRGIIQDKAYHIKYVAFFQAGNYGRITVLQNK